MVMPPSAAISISRFDLFGLVCIGRKDQSQHSGRSDWLGQAVKTSQLSIEPQVHSRESNSAFLDLNSSSERIPF